MTLANYYYVFIIVLYLLLWTTRKLCLQHPRQNDNKEIRLFRTAKAHL